MPIQLIDIPESNLTDSRGFGFDPFALAGIPQAESTNAHLVSLKPGAVRGNHVHRKSKEWIIAHGGIATIRYREPGKPTQTMELNASEKPKMIAISPNIDHAFENAGPTEMVLFVFRNHAGEDTFRVEMDVE